MKCLQEVEDESDGCGAKISVIIVSEEFSGKRTLQRHKSVHSVLREEMPKIHAFSQKTYTPKEWEEKQKQN